LTSLATHAGNIRHRQEGQTSELGNPDPIVTAGGSTLRAATSKFARQHRQRRARLSAAPATPVHMLSNSWSIRQSRSPNSRCSSRRATARRSSIPFTGTGTAAGHAAPGSECRRHLTDQKGSTPGLSRFKIRPARYHGHIGTRPRLSIQGPRRKAQSLEQTTGAGGLGRDIQHVVTGRQF